jgi:hypothetical protein
MISCRSALERQGIEADAVSAFSTGPDHRQDRTIYDIFDERPVGWPPIAIVRFSAVIASSTHASNALANDPRLTPSGRIRKYEVVSTSNR